MNGRFVLSLIWLLAVALGGTAVAAAPLLNANLPESGPIGLHVAYFTEAGGPLTLRQAVGAWHDGRFVAAHSRVLSFGIGSRPVWVHFAVANTGHRTLRRRLSIETAWLDHVDVYFRHGGKTMAAYHTGDTKPFRQRPVDSRDFAFDHAFPPGLSNVFVRVQTPDPMVIPMYLMPLPQARDRATVQTYSYGFLYGFLFALLAYNVMLYTGLRDRRYILYSLYLGMFLLMNISYTGHGFKWIWPSHPTWEQWSNPILMVAYGASGLVFAINFLDTRRHLPRMHKTVLAYLGIGLCLLLLTVLADSQRGALLVAFTFVFLFTFIMLTMGVVAVRSGRKPARYFLLAAISAMVGAAVTALAVWGFIPFNSWTFRAVDLGVLLDATLLALALTYQFRVSQTERLRAEQLATLDPLTGIDNRRAFYDKVAPVWKIALRHDHDLSVVLLDIDSFKRVNDGYGHAYGDKVLIETGRVLTKSVREQDLVARWGGEEFIVLLPETGLHEAAALAERLRLAIADMVVQHHEADIIVTASFGVAQRQTDHYNLDGLISVADRRLYQAKRGGRNQVNHG